MADLNQIIKNLIEKDEITMENLWSCLSYLSTTNSSENVVELYCIFLKHIKNEKQIVIYREYCIPFLVKAVYYQNEKVNFKK
jgi:hypothetical protein